MFGFCFTLLKKKLFFLLFLQLFQLIESIKRQTFNRVQNDVKNSDESFCLLYYLICFSGSLIMLLAKRKSIQKINLECLETWFFNFFDVLIGLLEFSKDFHRSLETLKFRWNVSSTESLLKTSENERKLQHKREEKFSDDGCLPRWWLMIADND